MTDWISMADEKIMDIREQFGLSRDQFSFSLFRRLICSEENVPPANQRDR